MLDSHNIISTLSLWQSAINIFITAATTTASTEIRTVAGCFSASCGVLRTCRPCVARHAHLLVGRCDQPRERGCDAPRVPVPPPHASSCSHTHTARTVQRTRARWRRGAHKRRGPAFQRARRLHCDLRRRANLREHARGLGIRQRARAGHRRVVALAGGAAAMAERSWRGRTRASLWCAGGAAGAGY